MDTKEFTNLTDALKRLKEDGYTANFVFESSTLHEVQSGKKYSVSEVKIVELYRFEGASDRDDMSVLYVLDCKDGTKGTITDAFGVYGNQKLAEFLKNVEDATNEAKPSPHS